MLCASFQSHLWIQIGDTVRKRPIWVKIWDFLSRVTLNFDGWPRKTIGHLIYATANFVHHLVAMCEFKLELQSGNTQIGWTFVLTYVTLTIDLWHWPFAWSSPLSMVKFMMVRWQKHGEKGIADGRTDGRTDGWTDGQKCSRAVCSQLKNIFKCDYCVSYQCSMIARTWITMIYQMIHQIRTPI